MNELVIAYKSKLDDKLYELYTQRGYRGDCGYRGGWFGFIRSLDPKIISVYKRNWDTHIAFEGEECKTWFLLKWT
jgi:hypothetical protein